MLVSHLLHSAIHAVTHSHPHACSGACGILASEVPTAKLISLLVYYDENLLSDVVNAHYSSFLI
jgi:hypothetical protein